MKTRALQSLWIPAKRPSKQIILVMHGRGDSYHGFTWLPGAMAMNNVNYLMLNAPDPSFTGFSWYGMPPDQLPGILRSRNLLEQTLDEIVAAGYKSKDILVLGFSQGCLMTLEWASRTTRRLGGCVGISGYCYDPELIIKEMSPFARQMPWWITHGEEDEVLPFARSSEQMHFLKEQGLPIEFYPMKKAHTIDEQEELPLLKKWVIEALFQ